MGVIVLRVCVWWWKGACVCVCGLVCFDLASVCVWVGLWSSCLRVSSALGPVSCAAGMQYHGKPHQKRCRPPPRDLRLVLLTRGCRKATRLSPSPPKHKKQIYHSAALTAQTHSKGEAESRKVIARFASACARIQKRVSVNSRLPRVFSRFNAHT